MGFFDLRPNIYVVLDGYDDIEYSVAEGQTGAEALSDLLENINSGKEFIQVGNEIVNKKYIVNAYITK